MPKSSTRTLPSRPSRTLAGLTSRCTTPCSCACASPAQTAEATRSSAGVAELALAQRAGEIHALDDVGGDVDVLAVLVHAAQAHDVRVPQLARDRRLAPRALAQRRVVRDRLERHDLLALEVERAEDRAGSAHAEHAVDPEAVADHPGGEQRGAWLTGGFRHQEAAPGQGVRGRSGGSIGASCKGSDIRSGPAEARWRRPGVIVVRQGNRAVLLRRVRSRRRPPDGGASAGVGPWQARRPRRRRQRPRYAPHPARRRRRRARAGAGLRRARLLLRLVQGRPVPLLRAGRELRRAPVQHRRQGARRRALQPGADARPGDRAGRELHPRARAAETTAAALKPTGKIKQQDLQRYLLQALQYRTLALQDLAAALKTALLGKKADVPATEAQRKAVANAYSELIASDVVYAASFQRPAQAILKEENVTDAAIISSVWGLSPELANPDPQRQRALDRVGARRRLVEAVPGRRHRHLDRRGHGERQDAHAGHPRHDRQAEDPEHVHGHGRQSRQLPGARHRDPPHRGRREDAGDPGQVAPAQRDRDEDVPGDGQPGRGQGRRRRADRRRRDEQPTTTTTPTTSSSRAPSDGSE